MYAALLIKLLKKKGKWLKYSKLCKTYCIKCNSLLRTLQFTLSTHMLLYHRVPHGPLGKYVKLRVRMRRECRERFPRHRG